MLKNLLNLIDNNFGKDNSIIGLSGLKKRTEYLFITIPKDFKKTSIQNTKNNYLLL